jgi:hypothetical protein
MVFNESLGTEHADNLENENFTRSMKFKAKRVVAPGGSIKNGRSGFKEGRRVLLNFTLAWRACEMHRFLTFIRSWRGLWALPENLEVESIVMLRFDDICPLQRHSNIILTN